MDYLKELPKYCKHIKVLYVEDDEQVRSVTKMMLESFFDDIDIAEDGQIGLEKYQKNSYDLIITDIRMPRLDGIGMVNEIRKVDEHIQILILSAVEQTNKLIDSIKLGIDGYILKPIDPNQFMQTLFKSVKNISLQSQVINSEKELVQDELTGLPSRHKLFQLINDVHMPNIPVVILINIDSFGLFNELYGIDTGNEILLHFTEFLQKYKKQTDYELFRTSGDEFVLFEESMFTDIDKYENDLERLFEMVNDYKLTLNQVKEPIRINITVGISFSSENPLSKAAMALHRARELGIEFIGYSHDLDREAELKENLYWQQVINDAVEEQRVMAYYQPIYNRNDEVIKFEALMRIRHTNDKGEEEIIAPGNYLDLSKKTKQYVKLTKYIVEQTLKEMRECDVHICINLTYQDIKNNAIYRTLKENIKKYNLAQRTKFDISNSVIFELIESNSIENYEMFRSFIQEFKDMGVKITIDNFGSGFSDFSRIVSLAPNYVKIDGDLIKNINVNHQSLTLVKALIKFTKELGIKTIAEHVESKEIFDTVYALGIDEFQGYYFGEPSTHTSYVCGQK